MTPQRVAGALKRFGLDASKKSSTAARGWTHRTPGFRTTNSVPFDGSILVFWELGSHQFDHARELVKIRLMKQILESDGFAVVLEELGNHPKLIVRVKT